MNPTLQRPPAFVFASRRAMEEGEGPPRRVRVPASLPAQMLVPGEWESRWKRPSFNSGTGTSTVASIVGARFDLRFNGVFDLFPVFISWEGREGKGKSGMQRGDVGVIRKSNDEGHSPVGEIDNG